MFKNKCAGISYLLHQHLFCSVCRLHSLATSLLSQRLFETHSQSSCGKSTVCASAYLLG